MMTGEEESTFGRIAALIQSARRVVVSGHTNPDGDALGSALALSLAIEARWPGVEVQPILANDRPVDELYSFLPGVGRFVPAARYEGDPDLFVAVDTPTLDRLADSAAVFARSRSSAAIDHHPTRDPYAQVTMVREHACAAGEVVYDFVRYLGIVPSAEVATCLLTAIVTDTGRFQYQNTTADTLRAAADLVDAGASPSHISSSVYQSLSMAALRLKEALLSRLATTGGGRVAYSYVTQADLARCGGTADDCESLIDEVRSLGGTEACLFLRELSDGSLRGNLRSKVDWLDVSEAARVFGGGGHRAAAGFTIDGPADVALSRALDALVSRLEADRPAAGPDGGRRR